MAASSGAIAVGLGCFARGELMLVDERMLLQQDFDTHDKMSLGAPIADWTSLKFMASLTRSRTQ